MPTLTIPGRARRRAAVLACAGLAAWLSVTAAPAQQADPARRADTGDAPLAWAVYDAAPFMIRQGADRDRGIFDRIRHLLDERLAGAPQATLTAPLPRILALLRDGAELCFIGAAQTREREAFALFSVPVAMYYPLRIVVKDAGRSRFAPAGPLSLAALLADRSLRTSTLRDRALGEPIDALLRRDPPTRFHSETGEAFHMLLAGRLDYLLEFSPIAAYAQSRHTRDGDIVALPFVEAPPPILARVMCPRTDWGRRQIARIDDVLRVERPASAYRDIVEAWSDEADRPTIRRAFDAVLLTSR